MKDIRALHLQHVMVNSSAYLLYMFHTMTISYGTWSMLTALYTYALLAWYGNSVSSVQSEATQLKGLD